MKEFDEYEEMYDAYDTYADEGCGEGYSCEECDNYGCPAHPMN